MRTLRVFCVMAVATAACKRDYIDLYPPDKTTPDLYQIDTNVPDARVTVYDGRGRVLSTQQSGESFKKLERDSIVEIEADGYYTYKGPVDGLERVGKKSWFVRLERR